mmetsp:Transcript_3577/g.6226  ORF Transcript_3577/g.6226 Transcript_3577/m.6226 type:complete len:208 (-) Transcript_3577:292-915(-)
MKRGKEKGRELCCLLSPRTHLDPRWCKPWPYTWILGGANPSLGRKTPKIPQIRAPKMAPKQPNSGTKNIQLLTCLPIPNSLETCFFLFWVAHPKNTRGGGIYCRIGVDVACWEMSEKSCHVQIFRSYYRCVVRKTRTPILEILYVAWQETRARIYAKVGRLLGFWLSGMDTHANREEPELQPNPACFPRQTISPLFLDAWTNVACGG